MLVRVAAESAADGDVVYVYEVQSADLPIGVRNDDEAPPPDALLGRGPRG